LCRLDCFEVLLNIRRSELHPEVWIAPAKHPLKNALAQLAFEVACLPIPLHDGLVIFIFGDGFSRVPMIATEIPDSGVLVSFARALNYIDQNSFPLFVERPSAIDLNLLKKLRMVRIYDEMGLDAAALADP
jgi:hypothetical protein